MSPSDSNKPDTQTPHPDNADLETAEQVAAVDRARRLANDLTAGNVLSLADLGDESDAVLGELARQLAERGLVLDANTGCLLVRWGSPQGEAEELATFLTVGDRLSAVTYGRLYDALCDALSKHHRALAEVDGGWVVVVKWP